MHRTTRVLYAALIAGLVPAFSAAAPDFEKEIQPILEANCIRCHGPGKVKGNLRLHTKEDMLKGGDIDAAIEPGNAERSLMIERLHLPVTDDERMPQEADPLRPEQIALIEEWINAGAPWPEGVRLKAKKQTIAEEELIIPDKAPKDLEEVGATIDKLIAAETADRDFPKAGQIDDNTFLRRATIDLIGRIPTYEEIQEFNDWPAGERREKLVDKLLEDPRYADRWMVFYSDMLRVRSNARGGRELQAWVHQSVASNKPWDKMAYELISASGRTTRNPAVGYILNDGADPMSMAAATAQVFLGVRLSCAQCHDHPFDDWQQMEFYELAAYFGKTIQRENQFSNTVYTTEQDMQRVQWPPEREQPPSREPVEPRFPFELVTYNESPHYISRLEDIRTKEAAIAAAADDADSLDNLLETDTAEKALDGGLGGFDVLGEAKKASEDLNVEGDLYRISQLRDELAGLVTSPRNQYFARAFVNRVWAELNGRGFVEPLDNFNAYEAQVAPQTMEYISREFVASGYDLKQLIRMIMASKTYSRGHLEGDHSPAKLEMAEKYFGASPVRRMIGETLYDSVVIAGHLEDYKWRQGENVRLVTTQIRIPIVDDNEPEPEAPAAAGDGQPNMMANNMAPGGGMMAESAGAGYDLEAGIEVDFAKVLSDAAKTEEELNSMKAMADAELKRQEEMRMMAEAQRRRPQRYQLKTIQEEKDDNPRFTSTMRMPSPAPADHFVRVFGQPSRATLGEFRDSSSSLRQQLMMLNGKATHEAARVGSLEPMHAMLSGDKPQIGAAIKRAYLECLTREPDADEFAMAKELLESSETPIQGMGDLRWALLNCHEFRFLP